MPDQFTLHAFDRLERGQPQGAPGRTPLVAQARLRQGRALLGTLVGVLPGIGPAATLALLLPLTFQLEPAGAIIMMAAIYYGAQYGGSTTAILLKLPGECSGVVTALDGHRMALMGRAGPAIAVAALASHCLPGW